MTWIVAAALGGFYGAAATIAASTMIGDVFPIGLLIGLAGTCALLMAVRFLTSDRWAVVATGIGALMVSVVLSGQGPGGSVVVPQPAEGEFSVGQAWLIGLVLLIALVTAWPARSATRPATPAESTPSAN